MKLKAKKSIRKINPDDTTQNSSRTPDLEWLRARRELLAKTKAEVHARLGEEPRDVQAYAKRYQQELHQPWKISDKPELIKEISRVPIVYGGDFHALGQAQRTHLKILRALPADREVALALECFPITGQRWVDAYLQSKIDARQLCERVGWQENWGFPFENYRPLLEIARRKGWRVLALNEKKGVRAKGSLQKREIAAAAVIERFRKARPETLIYVIFGDLHLAQAHLPLQVRRAAKKPLKSLTIHLNPERIYFQLAKKGLEHTADVVRFRKGDFCVCAVPPWVQWQSYLFFLERTLDSELKFFEPEDYGEELDDDDDDNNDDNHDDETDPTDQVLALAKMAATDLGLDLKFNDLESYLASDQRIWSVLESRLNALELRLARELCSQGRSFFLPNGAGKGGVGILGRATVNHAASLAGHYIYSKLSKIREPLWTLPESLDALIWQEASAYFVSKLINHKRQSETLLDLRAQLLRKSGSDLEKDVLKIALDRAMSELLYVSSGRDRQVRFEPRRKASYLEASRILGGMMGEKLYIAYRSRKIKAEDVVRWMKMKPASRQFRAHYLKWVKKLSEAHIKSRPERL